MFFFKFLGRRTNEENRKRRGSSVGRKSRKEDLSFMHCEFSYRVNINNIDQLKIQIKITLFLIKSTLYCAKNNYEFGISRVMKSLEPYPKKLGIDTWFYTKRCFLALFENMAKNLILLKDQFLGEIIQFLTHCESNINHQIRIIIIKILKYCCFF